MKPRLDRAFCLFLTLTASAPVYSDQPARCGTVEPSQSEIEEIEGAVSRGRGRGRVSVTIPVWVHVINKGSDFENGDVSDHMIDEQIRVLNDSFNGWAGGANTDFGFELVGVTRTTNQEWFENMLFNGVALNRDVELAAKQALRQGGPETLNIYTVNLGGYYQGFAWYPTILNTSQAVLDGIVLDWRTLPGSPLTIYFEGVFSEGDTANHEAGHWLGLFHTFHHSCSKSGDYADDTPAELSPAYFCPVERDSCTSRPGFDPIRNFMDYTQDSCMYEFTENQAERMQAAWAAYRSPE